MNLGGLALRHAIALTCTLKRLHTSVQEKTKGGVTNEERDTCISTKQVMDIHLCFHTHATSEVAFVRSTLMAPRTAVAFAGARRRA